MSYGRSLRFASQQYEFRQSSSRSHNTVLSTSISILACCPYYRGRKKSRLELSPAPDSNVPYRVEAFEKGLLQLTTMLG